MKSTVNKKFALFGNNILMKYKYLFFLLFLLIIFFSIIGLKHIIMDNSSEQMLDKDDPIRVHNEIFKDLFDNSDYIFLLVEADNVIKTDVLKYIRRIGEDIEQKLPFVNDYLGLTQIENITVKNNEMMVEDLIGDTIPGSTEALKDLKEKILSKKIYINRFINKKCNQTGIFIRLENLPDTAYVLKNIPTNQPEGIYFADQVVKNLTNVEDSSEYKIVKDVSTIITPTLEYLLDQHKSKYKTTATGVPISDYYIATIMKKQTGKAFAITLLIAIIMLVVLYRSFRAVIATFITVISAIIITFGIIGWLGIIVSTFALVVALLLLVISVGYSIHLINHFRREYFKTGDRMKAVWYTYEHSGWPCFITAITTIIGFLSFLVVDMVPVRNMGLTCAIGVTVTFLIIIFLIPAIFSLGKNKKVKSNNVSFLGNKESKFMRQWAILSIKNFRITSILTLVILGFCLYYIFQIKADTNFINLFGSKHKFVRDAKHSTENIGSLYSYDVLLQLPEENMAKDPSILKNIERLDSLILTFETTKITNSVNNILKSINQTMHDNNPEYFKVPDTKNLIGQYFLLYEIGGGDEISNWVDFSYQNLRTAVRVKKPTSDLIDNFHEIKKFVKNHFPEKTRTIIAGGSAIKMRAIAFLVNGQLKSIVLAFLGITLVIIIALRSFYAGIISMIPNIIPVFIVFGFMGLLGITLNIQTIVAAPVILGIAVDDTVHYFIHYKQEFNNSRSYKMANIDAFSKVGWALVNTSLILIIGFLSFSLSTVKSLNQISVLFVLGVFFALIGDMLITPALFNLLRPFGKEKIEENQKN